MECPNAFMLEGATNEFEITVDTSGLKEGLHYAEVQGFDTMAVWKGPLFRVPVTVARLAEVLLALCFKIFSTSLASEYDPLCAKTVNQKKSG